MKKNNALSGKELSEHFFREEYGKMVSVITRYIGTTNVETAEDIVQETLLKAVDHWQQNGIPQNPRAWLYTTAKNQTLNILKRKQYKIKYETDTKRTQSQASLQDFEFSEDLINDEQLKMMFVCCHPSISEDSQIALILKILCGFSIAEIASAFFSNTDTINKRLVRGRKQLRNAKISVKTSEVITSHVNIVLKTIYLLFNEGYSPSQQNKIVRYDLCLEAIRLAEILAKHKTITQKSEVHALLALMYLNAARFEARSEDGVIVEMHKQNRKRWNTSLINTGIYYLNLTTKDNIVSVYQILATISGHHCIASSFENTNWKAILSLYDHLLTLEDTVLVRLNRSIPLAKVHGNTMAIKALKEMEHNPDMKKHYLFHATLAEFYTQERDIAPAMYHLENAISLCSNSRDISLFKKKLEHIVPKS